MSYESITSKELAELYHYLTSETVDVAVALADIREQYGHKVADLLQSML